MMHFYEDVGNQIKNVLIGEVRASNLKIYRFPPEVFQGPYLFVSDSEIISILKSMSPEEMPML